jgi:hypothetical protein
MKHILLFLLLGPIANAVCVAKSCEELAVEIAAKLDAAGVKNYSLEIVPTAIVGGEKVVGSCENGEKKIVYLRTKVPPSPPAPPRKN